MSDLYSNYFYSKIEQGSYQSAMEVVPFIVSLLNPKSVVDIGCGTGVWLSVFSQFGIRDIQGYDGGYVNVDQLKISSKCFQSHDLRTKIQTPHQYDLAISLEVAEHIEPEFAETFIQTLTSLSRQIIFSAAIPGQTGVYHVNEQYPEYWCKLFLSYGYIPIDLFRPVFWKNLNICYWYRQNMIFFIHQSHVNKSENLISYHDQTRSNQLNVIIPEAYQRLFKQYQYSMILNRISGYRFFEDPLDTRDAIEIFIQCKYLKKRKSKIVVLSENPDQIGIILSEVIHDQPDIQLSVFYINSLNTPNNAKNDFCENIKRFGHEASFKWDEINIDNSRIEFDEFDIVVMTLSEEAPKHFLNSILDHLSQEQLAVLISYCKKNNLANQLRDHPDLSLCYQGADCTMVSGKRQK